MNHTTDPLTCTVCAPLSADARFLAHGAPHPEDPIDHPAHLALHQAAHPECLACAKDRAALAVLAIPPRKKPTLARHGATPKHERRHRLLHPRTRPSCILCRDYLAADEARQHRAEQLAATRAATRRAQTQKNAAVQHPPSTPATTWHAFIPHGHRELTTADLDAAPPRIASYRAAVILVTKPTFMDPAAAWRSSNRRGWQPHEYPTVIGLLTSAQARSRATLYKPRFTPPPPPR